MVLLAITLDYMSLGWVGGGNIFNFLIFRLRGLSNCLSFKYSVFFAYLGHMPSAIFSGLVREESYSAAWLEVRCA